MRFYELDNALQNAVTSAVAPVRLKIDIEMNGHFENRSRSCRLLQVFANSLQDNDLTKVRFATFCIFLQVLVTFQAFFSYTCQLHLRYYNNRTSGY